MLALTSLFLLLAQATFADVKLTQPATESVTAMFARSCAHDLDAEDDFDLSVREMQRWLEVYLRDPDPSLPSDYRLANVLSEIFELAVDRLADFPKAERKLYREQLDEAHLDDGHVPDVSDAEIFLSTVTAMNHDLRRLGKTDLAGPAFAGIALTVMSGQLYHDEIRVGYEDPQDVDTEHLVIEPEAHNAFTLVEKTVDELRRGPSLNILRSTIVPHFNYRRAAAFEMIAKLEEARGFLPNRIHERIGQLTELRKTFDGDDGDEKVVEFNRMVAVLVELQGYVKLADQMTRIGWAVWEGERVSPVIHYTDSAVAK